MEKVLVVIDGNSLINRAYYAIQRPMITKEGIYTQGIYAFLSMLGKIRSDYKPTHMLVAFDRKAPTFRHLEYTDYKAGRKKMPIELAMEIPYLKDILDAMGIPRFEIDGFEADDIIGTATRISEEAGVHSYVITGDRDALQLATDLTSVIINKRGMTDFKLYDDAAMMEEYGFDHIRFIDYKALRGDTSDNIPGIPGVGEKTAGNLIKQFGSLEDIIARSSEITNEKLRTKVEEGAMSAMMSKRLATIVRTVPMDMEFEDFAIKEENTDALISLYTKLEFKTYLSKLLSKSANNPLPEKTEEIACPEIITVKDRDEGLKLFNSFEDIFVWLGSDNNHKEKPLSDELLVFSKDKIYNFEPSDFNNFIKDAFSGKKMNISAFKLKNIYYYLLANGADVSGLVPSFDVSVAYYLLNANSKERSLEELALEYCHIKLSDNEQLSIFGSEGSSEKSAKKLYVCTKIAAKQFEEITKEGLAKVLYEIDLPLTKVLASMEAEGFRADREILAEFGENLKTEINKLEKEIIELAGEEFNINSPMQLGNILFEKLGLPSGKKTSRGYSTNAEILEKLAPDYPIVAKVLEYRTYAKLNSTYVEGLLPLMASDGKIRAHFQQTVAATGRISCTEPNLQNIPVRSELGRSLRKVFTASSKDNVLVGADYSQIELRVMASMSGDKTLISAFNEGRDIHKETASKVFGVAIEDVTPTMRSNAKAVNFGVIYGMSQYGLSSELTISRKEAEKYINDYFERFKDVKLYLEKCVSDCRISGESRTLFGRKRSVPEISASQFMIRQLGERLAMNTPIQGTAADIIKIAMNRVYERLAKEIPEAKLILQIHDELIIDTPAKYAEKVSDLLRECMEEAVTLPVKLEVSENVAYNWYDLK